MADQAEQKTADQGGQPPLPPDSMILLPVRQTVLFPGIVLPLSIGRKSSIAAAQEAVRSQRMLGVILQTDPAVEEPTPEQLHRVGTAAQVLRYVTAPDGTHHVVAQGVRRFRVIEYLRGFPFLVGSVARQFRERDFEIVTKPACWRSPLRSQSPRVSASSSPGRAPVPSAQAING